MWYVWVYSPQDILVKVRACALNPVDYKRKNGLAGEQSGSLYERRVIVGYDAAGSVEQVGSDVHHFKVGDDVYYSGNIQRDGSLQQYQLVDARLVARKPSTLSFEEAAALPLTTITAYEALTEELRVQSGKSILITAGAGGVGSMASQLAKHWGLTVITTASRPETVAWTKKYGADHVVDHRKGIAVSFKEQQLANVDYCFNTFGEQLLPDVVAVIKPFGAVCGINGNLSDKEVVAVQSMFRRRIAFHNEYMMAKPVWGVNEQSVGDMLQEVAELVDAGTIRSTLNTRYSWNEYSKAFDTLEKRSTIGKIVLTIDDNAV